MASAPNPLPLARARQLRPEPRATQAGQKSVKRTPSQLLLEKQEADVARLGEPGQEDPIEIADTTTNPPPKKE